MPKNLKRMTLREQAEEALREMIASHRFGPGKWINVERLAKDLGVSRTPVWLALKNLEKEGLVTHVPKRGMRMAQMTLPMALDLYRVRERLEGLAARLAAEKMSRNVIARMESLVRRQARYVEIGDLYKYSRSDFLFHGLIYESSGNGLLKELLDNVKSRSRPIVCDISPILKGLYEDHVRVLSAFQARDGREAERVMCRHNQRMLQLIQQAMVRRRAAGPLEERNHEA